MKFKKILVVLAVPTLFFFTSCSLINNQTTTDVKPTSTETTQPQSTTTLEPTTTTTIEPTTVVPTTTETTTTTEVIERPEQTDFSNMNNRAMESAVKYQMNFKPSDGFVGDVMPYYEDGTFYIFYLKDQGNSYNHSIFLAETKDFLHYVDKGEILRSSNSRNAQDNWIGTGSVCKVDNTYYFFYTGHNANVTPNERVMVAKSEGDLYHFEKLDGIYIDPAPELSKKDFRDPDVTYDSENEKFILTITTNANVGGTVIVKYTVDKNLSNYTYDKIIYTDTEDFWNLECTDTFKIKNWWYLSYSGQDDTLWVAKSRSQYTGYGSAIYGSATRIEGKYFYAPKAVSDGVNTYFVGWARRRGSQSDSGNGTWGGNISVSKVVQNEDGSIYLDKLDNLNDYYRYNEELENTSYIINQKQKVSVSKQYESFVLEGKFKYTGTADFGFEFGIGKAEADLGHIRISPSRQVMEYCLRNLTKVDTEVKINIKENQEYNITLVCEGSVMVLYLNGISAMTTRYYGKLSSDFGLFTSGSTVEFSNLSLKLRA